MDVLDDGGMNPALPLGLLRLKRSSDVRQGWERAARIDAPFARLIAALCVVCTCGPRT